VKVVCLLFLTMNCAGLMLGTGYAAPSQQTPAGSPANEGSTNAASNRSQDDHLRATPADDGKRQKEESPSGQQVPRRAAAQNRPRSRANLTVANRPKQLPLRRKRSKPLNATNPYPADLDKSGDAAQGRNRTANNALPVRSTSVVRPTGASRINVRHRGPNPAVVGGPASNAGNTGALNGTRMHRRP
jgi:hypothetical protein